MSYRYDTLTVPSCANTFNTIVQRHLTLQQAVLDELGPDQNLLHVLDEDGWISLLTDPRHHTVTCYDDNHSLVGQAIVLLPNNENMDADMINMKLPSSNPNDLATFRTIMSHPNYRGHRVMENLLAQAREIALENGRNQHLGCITRSNTPSWSQFLKTKMVITGCGHDPSDNSTVYYAHRNNEQPLQYDDGDTITVEHDMNLEELKSIFAEGYVGTQAEKSQGQYTNRLIMHRRLG